jgi:hypothetical protein
MNGWVVFRGENNFESRQTDTVNNPLDPVKAAVHYGLCPSLLESPMMLAHSLHAQVSWKYGESTAQAQR